MTIQEAAPVIGAVTGTASFFWLAIQAGDRLWGKKNIQSVECSAEHDELRISLCALVKSQEMLTIKIGNIADAMHVMAANLTALEKLQDVKLDNLHRSIEQLASIRAREERERERSHR